MFYQEALDYIRNVERMGVDLGIERMRELLDLLGAPDRGLRFVHVAGTNGKGSVTAYLTSALKESGYRVGTYNSPSVFCYNERFLLDGTPACDTAVARVLTAVRDAIECEQASGREFHPTAFEIETAAAMCMFAEESVDIVVMETGLGGRWDATNAVLGKEIAVITRIGMDHCGILGNTLKDIAAEKAAIIKDLAVTFAQENEVMREIYHPYEISNGEKIFRDTHTRVCGEARVLSSSKEGQRFLYGGREYFISMLGEHQTENAALAIETLIALKQKGWEKISGDSIAAGLSKTRWRARFEIVDAAKSGFDKSILSGKTLIYDGSHNPQGAQTLARSLTRYFERERICLVLGVLKDKDVEGILRVLVPVADRIVTVTPPSERAMDAKTLRDMAERVYEEVNKSGGCKDTAIECADSASVREAAVRALGYDCGAIAVCGSLTLFEGM